MIHNTDFDLYNASVNPEAYQNYQMALNKNFLSRNEHRHFLHPQSGLEIEAIPSGNNSNLGYHLPAPQTSDQRFSHGGDSHGVGCNVRKDLFNDTPTYGPTEGIGKIHSPLNGIYSNNIYWNAVRLGRRDLNDPSVPYNARKDFLNETPPPAPAHAPPDTLGKIYPPLGGIYSNNIYWNPVRLDRRDPGDPGISYRNVREKTVCNPINVSNLIEEDSTNGYASYGGDVGNNEEPYNLNSCSVTAQSNVAPQNSISIAHQSSVVPQDTSSRDDGYDLSVCNVTPQTESTYSNYNNENNVPTEDLDVKPVLIKPVVTLEEGSGSLPEELPKQETFYCNECESSFNIQTTYEQAVAAHERAYHAKIFFCCFCAKSYKWVKSLNLHLQKMHPDCTPFTCKVCGRIFSNNYNLVTHEKDCCKAPYMEPSVDPETGMEGEESGVSVTGSYMSFSPSIGSFPCHICGKKYISYSGMRKHVNLVHTQTNSVEGEGFVTDGNCVVCQSNTCDHVKLKEGGTLNPDTLAKCCSCGKEFADFDLLRSHMLLHIEKKYLCDVCGKTFLLLHKFEEHSKVHMRLKLFVCSFCKKAFRYAYNLKIHKRKHTGEKPYDCHLCNKSFRSKGTLKIHIMRHTGESQYQCEICNKTFAYKSYRSTHMRTHTNERPFKCTICPKAYTQKSSLNLHMEYHAGEYKYKCPVCNRSFLHQNYLTLHMRTHTGEKPYKCAMCDRAFSQRSSHNTHKKHCPKRPKTLTPEKDLLHPEDIPPAKALLQPENIPVDVPPEKALLQPENIPVNIPPEKALLQPEDIPVIIPPEKALLQPENIPVNIPPEKSLLQPEDIPVIIPPEKSLLQPEDIPVNIPPEKSLLQPEDIPDIIPPEKALLHPEDVSVNTPVEPHQEQ